MAYSNNRSTFFCPAGTKWYWEFVPTTTYNYAACGITTISHEWDINPGGGNSTPSGHGVGFYGVEVDVDGSRTNPAGNSAWASGDIIGFAYDVDANTIKKYINGSLDFTYSSVPVSTDGDYSPSFGDFGGSATATINVNFGQDSSFAGLKTAQGNQDSNGIGDFYYEPPTGHMALCTSNLPSPEIALPTDHFNTVLYNGGDVTGSVAVIGAGFQPDLVWLKTRNAAYSHQLHDAVRGAASGPVYSDLTNPEDASYPIASFDSDGFSTGTQSNNGGQNSDSMVVWNWKAGGSHASLSANATAGFSIAKNTGTGSQCATNHGLGVTPNLVIWKNLDDTSHWFVWSDTFSNATSHFLFLEDNVATVTSGYGSVVGTINSTSASILTGGVTSGIDNNDDFVMYSFANIEGYSKHGSYVGNGVSQNGPFVYTGFRPAFFMVKNASTGSTNWRLYDNKRPAYNSANLVLYPSTSGAEAGTGHPVDLDSNGVKIRGTWTEVNTNGDTYIYLAFAESPFKTSNAR